MLPVISVGREFPHAQRPCSPCDARRRACLDPCNLPGDRVGRRHRVSGRGLGNEAAARVGARSRAARCRSRGPRQPRLCDQERLRRQDLGCAGSTERLVLFGQAAPFDLADVRVTGREDYELRSAGGRFRLGSVRQRSSDDAAPSGQYDQRLRAARGTGQSLGLQRLRDSTVSADRVRQDLQGPARRRVSRRPPIRRSACRMGLPSTRSGE